MIAKLDFKCCDNIGRLVCNGCPYKKTIENEKILDILDYSHPKFCREKVEKEIHKINTLELKLKLIEEL